MIPERLARGEDSVTFETVRLRRDGSPIDVRMTASVVRDDAGHVRWTAFIVHDISERKAAETAQREYSQRLQVLSRMVLEAQETERASLARELHDQLGPMLGAAKLGLQVFQRHHKNGAASLNDIIATVDQAMQQTRTLALDLRPPQLDELGLATTVRSYAERLAKSSRFRLHFEAGELPELASQIDIACFRVAQVALTNVVQHAGAANVWVSLSVENDMLCLRVCDDGSGFNVRQAQRQALRGDSMGLLSMEERTVLAGGRFAIQSEPDTGTQIEARFPLHSVALAVPQGA
jgi:signal transduction histidine kinase